MTFEQQQCKTCGTTTLPIGAIYWDDTEQTVAARRLEARRAQRRSDWERERGYVADRASQQTKAELLAKYAAEFTQLRQQFETELLAEVDARYPDLAETATSAPATEG